MFGLPLSVVTGLLELQNFVEHVLNRGRLEDTIHFELHALYECPDARSSSEQQTADLNARLDSILLLLICELLISLFSIFV